MKVSVYQESQETKEKPHVKWVNKHKNKRGKLVFKLAGVEELQRINRSVQLSSRA